MSSISARTRECESGFDAILVAIESSNNASSESSIRDERARFRVWAANLGAAQPPHSTTSLDHRLRDGPRMKDSVVSNLTRLKAVCDRVLPILSGDVPNRTGPSSEAGGDAESTNELEQLLLNIKSAVNSLFALSILIRRQRPKGRLPGTADFVTLENSPDIMHVKDKFPKSRNAVWLAQRLGNAITQRRAALQYRQLHRKRLAAAQEAGSAKPSTTETATVSDAPSGTIATTFHEGPEGEAGQPASDRRSVYTFATSFVTTFGEEEEMARRIPDLSDLVLDGVQLRYGEPFECPYCRTIQSAANRFEWKRHVFADLQPYVCTFADCSEGLFSTRHEWFQHENNVHRRQWHCIYCSNVTPALKTEKDMEAHMKSAHGSMVTEAQLPLILEACERSLQDFGSSSCPLCDEWTPPPTGTRSAKEFCRHVARHLQLLSVSSMPLSIEGLEDTGRDSKAGSAESSNSDEQEDDHTTDKAGDQPSGSFQIQDREESWSLTRTTSPEFDLEHPSYARWFYIRALNDYKAKAKDEKSFKRGDVFFARHSMKDESGHWYVLKERSRGTRGDFIFVPKHCFEIMDDSEMETMGVGETQDPGPSRNRIAKTLSKIGSFLGTSTEDSGSFDEVELGGPNIFPRIPGEELRSPNLDRILRQYNDELTQPRTPRLIVSGPDDSQSPVQSSVDQSDFGPSPGARSSKTYTGVRGEGRERERSLEQESHTTSAWDCCKCETERNDVEPNCRRCGHSQCPSCSTWIIETLD